MAAVADAVEARHATVVAAHGLAVDDAGSRAQAGHGRDDQREAVGQVIAGAAVQTHAVAVLAGDDAEAVVLDLVQPRLAGGWRRGFGRQARRDETGRERHGTAIAWAKARRKARYYFVPAPSSAGRASGRTPFLRRIDHLQAIPPQISLTRVEQGAPADIFDT